MTWKINEPYMFIRQWKVDTCEEIFKVFYHKYNIL
jgi:hypothetical protein